MSVDSDAETLIRAGLARGLSLDAIIDAAQAQLTESTIRPATVLADPSGLTETEHWFRGHADAVKDQTILRPSTSAGPMLQRGEEGLSRYARLGLIGKGGMGEVHRVFDRRLGRNLALKVIRETALDRPGSVARFLEEAQTTAQLQHPGIIPIHDLGILPDGRVWFTMKEISGKTFGAVITEVHAVSRTGWRSTDSGWTLRRLVDVLRQVCEAVGYAHSRGVVHRDLKPSNIMVGSHGEVLVLDWGLAKLLGLPDFGVEDEGLNPVQTDRSRTSAHQTQAGMVAGTPAYMPPEQALGKVERVDARSDVYALGALLYEVLSGRKPYTGSSVDSVLEQVRSSAPAPLQNSDHFDDSLGFGRRLRSDTDAAKGPLLPPSLVAACERAMARDPEDRFDSAAELAAELRAWLEGAKRQEEARAVVARAESKGPEATELRAKAAALRTEAATLLKGVKGWQPEEDWLPGWKKQDAAAALEKRAELAELEEEQLLQGSLTHAPDLPEAHAALAARYRAEHEATESARQDATRAETLFRQHVAGLPEWHVDRPGHLAYLKGDGALTLVTDPPGAEVLLHRYVVHNRRLVPRFERSLGTTPLRSASLPMGSYLCVLKHPERAEVEYPVAIGRGEHWHGVPPEGGDPVPIPLPRPGELGPDECYVPPGWFAGGGDPEPVHGLSAQRIWVDGHIFRRFPVTNTLYVAFLDALVAEGRTADALRHAPREKGGTLGEQGALIYGFDGMHFTLRPDADGDAWLPEFPVCMVDWFDAQAFAAWEAARTGQRWRLPGELAWEKAARGVDGRFYPWGDGFIPSWTSMRRSHRGRPGPTVVGAFPVDESPYGIRDLAGSMCEWCCDAFAETGPPVATARHHFATQPGDSSVATQPATAQSDGGDAAGQALDRVIRGGGWYSAAGYVRTTHRGRSSPRSRQSNLGFRLVRPYPGPPDS